MPKVPLKRIVEYCDRQLRTAELQDYERASNGLQVANGGMVSRIAAAVDATSATVALAVETGADLLLVHHGLFWPPSHPWTGTRYKLLKLLLDNNLAVYSSHLPLDAHPKFGNNARLCAELGLTNLKPFFFDHGQFVGFQARVRLRREQLKGRLQHATGVSALLIPGGPEICCRIGVVSGGAGGELGKAAQEGVDTFITGEGPHWTYGVAEELGLNVLYGGHYATETFGVKALAAQLAKRFRVPWSFVDHPTGL